MCTALRGLYSFLFQKLAGPEQLPDLIAILYHNVQVRTGNTDIRVSGCVAHFGQGPAACQGVADERMPAVVDC
jgi:hypothetical protein